jgi:hypothetical protein
MARDIGRVNREASGRRIRKRDLKRGQTEDSTALVIEGGSQGPYSFWMCRRLGGIYSGA